MTGINITEMIWDELDKDIKYFKEELHEPNAGIEHKIWWDNLDEEDREYYDKVFYIKLGLLWDYSNKTSNNEFARLIDVIGENFNL